MKSNKEFIDSVYMKYEAYQKAEQHKETVRRRTIRYVSTLAACLILAVGVYGADRLGMINTGLFGNDEIRVTQGNDPIPNVRQTSDSEGNDNVISDDDTPKGMPSDIIEDEPSPEASPDNTGDAAEGSGAGTVETVGGIAALLAAIGAGIFGFSKKRRK